MPKATITDITNAGFRAEQFGSPADWLTASTGYVAVELARAGRWVEARIGATAYAAATAGTYLFDLLVQAETHKVASVFWRRRASYTDGNVLVGLQEGQYMERREYLKHAEDAEAAAEQALSDAIVEAGGTATLPGTGASFGHIETGRYPVASEGALNG
jgi:hypothetical protein